MEVDMVRLVAAAALAFGAMACTSKKAEKPTGEAKVETAAPADKVAAKPVSKQAAAPVQPQGVRFNVRDGAKLPKGFELQFRIQGKEVAPAGTEPENPDKGHFHLLGNTETTPAGTVIPSDAQHIHFGKGQTSAPLDLPVGKHKLTLLFADGAHRSFGPEWASTVNIEVVGKAAHRRVYFVGLKDGDTVSSPLTLNFGLDGMELSPAGQNAQDKTKGHHHLIIDGKSIALGQVVPSDAQHKHYGSGQTTATVELTPGEHTLTLQFADGLHQSYGDELSTTIKVTVK